MADVQVKPRSRTRGQSGSPSARSITRRGRRGPKAVRPSGRAARRHWGPLVYVLPALVMYGIFAALPWLQTVWYSFINWNGVTVGTWAGLSNYTEVLSDPQLRGAILHAFGLIIFYCLIPIVCGLIIAAILAIRKGAWSGAARTLLFLPQVLPGVAVGIAWKWMYDPNGLVNQVLRAIGLGDITRPWLGDFTWAYIAIGIVGAWAMTGMCVVFFTSGIGRIDRNLYEAAAIDGAGWWRQFRWVTVPGLRSEITVTLTLTAIAALSSFDIIFVTTNGGPGTSTMVPSVLIYQLAFSDNRIGTACALAVLLSALMCVFVALINKFSEEKKA